MCQGCLDLVDQVVSGSRYGDSPMTEDQRASWFSAVCPRTLIIVVGDQIMRPGVNRSRQFPTRANRLRARRAG